MVGRGVRVVSGVIPKLKGGGFNPGYKTAAVHFNGASDVSTNSLTATDGAFFSFSFWLKGNSDAVLWQVDGSGNYTSQFTTPSGTAAHLNPENAAGTVGASIDQSPADYTNWVNVLGSVDTNHAVGSKIWNLYLNDTTTGNTITDHAAAFTMAFNGLPFTVGNDLLGTFYTGDIADFWFAPNVFIDFSITANRRLFIDGSGKPVDLGANGQTPTGTAPAIFLRRAPSAAASTFASNLGSGGTFTIDGALTAASSSPSD